MTQLVRVGHIDLSFHDAAAREVEKILAAHGHPVERSAAPHEEMFRRIGRGEVDVLVAAWLPSSHGAYLAPVRKQVREVAVLYEPYCLWGVPEYVPAEAVAEIADPLRDPALHHMDRLIQGINPGAGISRFSAAIVEQYGLSEAGYRFQTGTETQYFGRFVDAVAEKRWVVVPLWQTAMAAPPLPYPRIARAQRTARPDRRSDRAGPKRRRTADRRRRPRGVGGVAPGQCQSQCTR